MAQCSEEIKKDVGPSEFQEDFKNMCEDYGHVLVKEVVSIEDFDESISTGLFKIDEACAILDTLRRDTKNISETILPALAKNVMQLEKLYIVIDMLEVLFSHIESDVSAMEERLDVVKKLSESLEPSGVKKILLKMATLKTTKDNSIETTPTDQWTALEFQTDTKRYFEEFFEKMNEISLQDFA